MSENLRQIARQVANRAAVEWAQRCAIRPHDTREEAVADAVAVAVLQAIRRDVLAWVAESADEDNDFARERLSAYDNVMETLGAHIVLLAGGNQDAMEPAKATSVSEAP
jgi:hypothetical protein